MKKIVLGIETSCDDTGVAILQGNKILGQALASSMKEHSRYGGIIPEIASRAHLESIIPCLKTALDESGVKLKQIDAIGVTAGPGLAGSLAVGASFAKSLSLSLGIPIYAINHVLAHLSVNQVQFGYFDKNPFVGLVVSGGHTSLFYVKNIVNNYREVGYTLDDAAGEAFDKVARLLDLPYPGGVQIDKLTQIGDNKKIEFPRALLTKKKRNYVGNEYNFSFSGVKTAVAKFVDSNKIVDSYERENSTENSTDNNVYLKADVAASFSFAINDVLVQKTIKLARDKNAKKIVVAGGFSANTQLRSMFSSECKANGIELQIPVIKLCTDNAVMVAMLTQNLLAEHMEYSKLDFPIDSSLDLSNILVS